MFRSKMLNSRSGFLKCSITVPGNRRKRMMKYEIIIAKITASLVILWIFSWTPYAVVALIGISGYQHLLTPGRKIFC